MFHGPGGGFFKKGGGTPNPFTVRQMPFFRGIISKVCFFCKVSEGISKKSPLAAGGKREYEWAVLLLSGYFITPIRDSTRACVVSERSALKYSVRHKVLREKRIKKTFSLKSTTLGARGGSFFKKGVAPPTYSRSDRCRSFGASSQKFAEKTRFQKVLVKSAPPGLRRHESY
jgi:hypothetical protein